MLRALILLFVFGQVCGPLHAGAWPRGEGNHFLSATTRIAATDINGPYSTYSTFFYEYGITKRLTIGVDIGRAVSGKIKAIGFARWPILQQSQNNRFAVELGIGTIAGSGVLRPGISFGRGIKTRWGGRVDIR